MRGPSDALRGEPLIRYVCTKHVDRDPIGPWVTIVKGSWALCVSHVADGHDWHEIEPMRREQIADPAQLQERRAI